MTMNPCIPLISHIYSIIDKKILLGTISPGVFHSLISDFSFDDDKQSNNNERVG